MSFVALGVAEMDAVAAVLVGIAAGDHVDQQAPAGQAVEVAAIRAETVGETIPGRIATRKRRRSVSGASAEATTQESAGASGGDQHAVIAKAVGRLCHLLQVRQRDRPRALAGAEEVAIAVGREEPEHVHRRTSGDLQQFGASAEQRRSALGGRRMRAFSGSLTIR